MVRGSNTRTPSSVPSPVSAEKSRATARALPCPFVDGTSADAQLAIFEAHKQDGGSLDFLRIPAVWMCFAFFFVYAVGFTWAFDRVFGLPPSAADREAH